MRATASPAQWIQGIEDGVGKALEKAARRRPTALELDAAPYIRTFERQARDYLARAEAFALKGERAAALIWANHARRAAENLSRIRAALTSC